MKNFIKIGAIVSAIALLTGGCASTNEAPAVSAPIAPVIITDPNVKLITNINKALPLACKSLKLVDGIFTVVSSTGVIPSKRVQQEANVVAGLSLICAQGVGATNTLTGIATLISTYDEIKAELANYTNKAKISKSFKLTMHHADVLHDQAKKIISK